MIPDIVGEAGSWNVICHGFEEWITASDVSAHTRNRWNKLEKIITHVLSLVFILCRAKLHVAQPTLDAERWLDGIDWRYV